MPTGTITGLVGVNGAGETTLFKAIMEFVPVAQGEIRLLGLPFALGAFIAGGLAAVAMLFLSDRSGLRSDVVIGLIFSAFFGLGLFMVLIRPIGFSVQTITMGNILAITPQDTLQLVIIGAVPASGGVRADEE